MTMRETQNAVLTEILTDNQKTDYGRRYQFAEIKTPEQFRETLPLTAYDDYAPLIDLLMRLNESDIITADKILCYIPFFIDGAAARFIPYTEKYAEMCGAVLKKGAAGLYFSPGALIGRGAPGGINEFTLLPQAGFFEFIKIPVDDFAKAPALLPEELTPGEKYLLIVTNLNGFYRYNTGDIVKVARFLDGAPVISIFSRQGKEVDFKNSRDREFVFGTAGKELSITNARC